MIRTLSVLALTLLLAGCGMNRAVGVLPNTLDDLGERSAPMRGDAPPVREKP
ncbi:hypothetical protein GTW51_16775 [Aurantimonas aggregata]|uniref:Uncharacterized protein n=1 Tax=Aurantimonas aggregata TaxID=2047720 RepID=A0A6L9MKJ8_9HYPH|nr:hypothetical protein [Aurantimonas aggregata]NDV88357.1 hypothetical protein [Aurantimonas aggregata]